MTKGVSVLYIPKMHMLKSGSNHREKRKRERESSTQGGRKATEMRLAYMYLPFICGGCSNGFAGGRSEL